jgi:hypothetical protein
VRWKSFESPRRRLRYLITEPETKERVAEAVRACGGQVLPARVARDGLTMSENQSKYSLLTPFSTLHLN